MKCDLCEQEGDTLTVTVLPTGFALCDDRVTCALTVRASRRADRDALDSLQRGHRCISGADGVPPIGDVLWRVNLSVMAMAPVEVQSVEINSGGWNARVAGLNMRDIRNGEITPPHKDFTGSCTIASDRLHRTREEAYAALTAHLATLSNGAQHEHMEPIVTGTMDVPALKLGG